MTKSVGLGAYNYWANNSYTQDDGEGVGAGGEAAEDVLDADSVVFQDAPLATEAAYRAHMARSVSALDDFESCLNAELDPSTPQREPHAPPQREATQPRVAAADQRASSSDIRAAAARADHTPPNGTTPWHSSSWRSASSRGSERPAGDHAIQLEDEEEIEGWGTIERLQRQLDMANLGLVLAGTVVMAVSIIAWDRFWWIGTLVEWVGWIGICGTFLGATTVVQVVIGHMGRVLFSRAILHMYVLSFVVTWCAMIGTGIICVPYYYQVDEIVNQNWRSLESVIGETVTKHEVQDKLRNHLIMMACTLMSCAAYAVLPHGLALRLRTLIGQSDQVQRKECSALRARHSLHQYASLVSMVTGAVGIGYGLWAVKLSIRARFHLFITYSNLALAVMTTLAAGFGLACAHPQIICYGKTYRVYFRTAMPALVGALIVFTVVTFSYISDVRPQMLQEWDGVSHRFPDRNLAQTITWMKQKLMIMGAILIAQAGCVSFVTFNAVKLEQQYLWCKQTAGFDPTMVNAGLCMRLIFQPAGFHVQAKIIWWQPGWVDSALILWNTFMGLGQIFWIGQFVLFSEYIRDAAADGEDGSSALFLQDWFVYGRADSRYITADPFIVSMETLVVLLIGPLSLLFAWTSFMRGPFRDVLGVVVGSLQIQLGLLYMLSSIINHGRNLRADGEKDVVWYWMWMVCIAIVRFVVPVPIALRSVFSIARTVRSHDWAEATQPHHPDAAAAGSLDNRAERRDGSDSALILSPASGAGTNVSDGLHQRTSGGHKPLKRTSSNPNPTPVRSSPDPVAR